MTMHLQEDSFYKDKLNGCYLNYSGSKWRYMGEIHYLLPQEQGLRALDLFCGGAGVASHMPIGWDIVANDLEKKLVAIHSFVKNSKELLLQIVDGLVKDYGLSNKDQLAFESIKSYYNKEPKYNFLLVGYLYLLICHSFSNQIRFNEKGEFNLPFGKRTFNKNMREKLVRFSDRCLQRDVNFTSKDFREFDFDDYDFLFIDPPYLETTATYNEKGGWGVEEETVLLTKLENTTAKWMLTNQIISKGKENKLLVDFIERGGYNVHILKDTTKNCNYQRKGGETVEVIVTNY